MMKRSSGLVALLSFVFLASIAVPSQAQRAAEASSGLFDAVIGQADAPVTIIEYSSLGCPHCADFHAAVMPRVKAQYIDTGKVKWIVRDFPLGTVPLAGAVVARCAGPEGYVGLLDVLFSTQDQWMQGADPIGNLEKTARQAGLGKERFDACIADDAMIQRIVARAREAEKNSKVNATPTFLVNGEKIVGMTSFDAFAKIVDRHLASARKR